MVLTESRAAAVIRVQHPDHDPLAMLLEQDLVIGRDCEGLSIRDPQVSRRHLRLRPVQAGVEVTDLDSTNGSYLEGLPLTSPRLVLTRSQVTIGDTVITIEFATDGAAGSLRRPTEIRTVDSLRSSSIHIVAESLAMGRAGIVPNSLDGETITIVFSDIEGSTEMANAIGDSAWFELLEHHNRILREEVVRYGGREVKSIGDGFMLVFPSARRALRFVTAVQARVEADDGPDLRIRMGLHTGEAIEGADGDFFGHHVNLAARVADMARGGEVIASLVVREIATGGSSTRFGPAFQVELKGFAEPQTVYEVLWSAE